MPQESLEWIVAGLDVLIRARYPLIAVNTPEEGRFHRIVRAVAQLKCHREKDKGLFELQSGINFTRVVGGQSLALRRDQPKRCALVGVNDGRRNQGNYW